MLLSNQELNYKLVIDQCLRISNDFHDNSTPFALCSELIEKVGINISEEKSWLVIANLEFVFVLKIYFTIRGWDFSKYIHFASPCKLKIELAKQLGIENFIEYSTEDIKNWKTNMKFDVIIGNPPYQGAGKDSAQKLWKEILVNSYDLLSRDGYLAFIIPFSWSKPVYSNGTKINRAVNEICFSNSIIDYDLDISYNFNVGCRISKIIIRKDNKPQNVNYIIPNVSGNLIFDKLLANKSKIKKQVFKRADETKWKQTIDRVAEPSETHNIPMLDKKILWSNIDDPFRMEKKIHFPRNFGYNVYLDANGEYGLTRSGESIRTDTPNETFSFYNSKLVRYIMKVCCWIPQTDFTLLHMIPYPVIEKLWTDQDLYQYFNLTQDEINLIEGEIK